MPEVVVLQQLGNHKLGPWSHGKRWKQQTLFPCSVFWSCEIPCYIEVPDYQIIQIIAIYYMYMCSSAFSKFVGNVAALKEQTFILKEGVCYKVKITFKVSDRFNIIVRR